LDAAAWDERYRTTEMLWSAGPNFFVADRLADREPGVGLDLASGEGRNAIWLASKGWDMTAVDFSSVALQRGREHSDDVEFVEADVFTWDPDQRHGDVGEDPSVSARPSPGFDLILIAYLQVEAEPLAELVERVRDWLNPGGELFMIGHDISNLDEGVGGPQVPEILWDLDLMLEWLGDLRLVEGGIVPRPVEVDGDIEYARDTLIRAVRPDQD
jgi:SAM-dependent methyltransferase